MPKVDVLDIEGKKKTSRELPPSIFDCRARPAMINNAVRYYRTRMRGGTASTKDRSEVHGTGKKMWAQKHTGRARHADAQAPQFRGGGRAHGAKPHRSSIHFPHRMRRLVLRAVLSDKLRDGRLRLLSLPKIEEPATKLFRGFQQRAGLPNGTVLFVFEPEAKMAHLSVNNLPKTRSCRAMSLTAYDVLASRNVVLTEKAVELIAKRLTEESNG